MADCIFCNKKLTDGATVTLGDKGFEGIAKASLQRESSIVVKPDNVIHRECRKKFCHPSEIERCKRKHSSDSETEPTLHLYTKSLHLYLQKMTKLEDTHPNVYQQFPQGLHVVRSDRFWARLSPDLVIEQVLMRSLKTSGGLTRGRGLTETQRLVRCLSRPVCAEVNMAMQQLTSITYETSEQHKDISQAWQTRGSSDCHKLLYFIDWRSPFEADSSLRNIVSRISAGSEVNVDDAKRIGYDILNEMVGQHVVKYSFRRKAQAVTFDSKSAVKIGDEKVQIDPLLLFHRLVIAGSQANDPPNVLTYELCNYPPALFEGKETTS